MTDVLTTEAVADLTPGRSLRGAEVEIVETPAGEFDVFAITPDGETVFDFERTNTGYEEEDGEASFDASDGAWCMTVDVPLDGGSPFIYSRPVERASQAPLAVSSPPPLARPMVAPTPRARAREGHSTRRATARAGPDDDPHPPPPPRGRSHDLTSRSAA
jgi:hypothetical protein